MTYAQLICNLILLAPSLAAQDKQPPEEPTEQPTSTIRITVTDENGASVAGAKAQILKWTGKYVPSGEPGISDDSGRIVLTIPYSDNHFYAKVTAPNYVLSLPKVQVEANKESELKLKLSQPVESYVEVFANDQPLAGAELSWFEYIDANGHTTYVNKAISSVLGLELHKSDEQGKLKLPPVPKGSKLVLKVLHQAYRQEALKDATAVNGRVGAVLLRSGVKLVLKFHPVAGEPDEFIKQIEGATADMLFFGDGPSRDSELIRHSYVVHDGRIELTAHTANYQTLRLDFDDYFVSPQLSNYPDAPNTQLDFRNQKQAQFDLTLIPKRKARGRVVDKEGKGVAEAFVSTAIARQDPGAEKARSTTPAEPNARLDYVNNWISGQGVETDRDGNYTVDVAEGRIKFEVIKDGYFSLPVEQEVDWSGRVEDTFPTVVVHRVPVIRGQVIDAAGMPKKDVIVRLKHTGYGDADPYAVTKDDGSFELKMTRIPYKKDGSTLETVLHVLAFDPKSTLAGLGRFDAMSDSVNHVEVKLEPHESHWVTEPFGKLPKTSSEEAWAKTAPERRQRFSEGGEGRTVPDLHEGTWFNTTARSLTDFRGKYVLLDFWFIGCGPCIRDMPSVKMVHQAYQDQGFTVVSVHDGSQTPEQVMEFAKTNNMTYPIVVDRPEEPITNQFKKIGLDGFPTYILLDPEGKILINDAFNFDGETLRDSKVELIHEQLHK